MGAIKERIDMKIITDGGCKCHKIVAEINRQYPHADWNCDEACNAWHKRRHELEDTGVEGEEYCCNCPTCGRIICAWCYY